MCCRGVRYAIMVEEAERLRSLEDENERLNHLFEKIGKLSVSRFHAPPDVKPAH